MPTPTPPGTVDEGNYSLDPADPAGRTADLNGLGRELRTSRTQRHRADARKATGVHYTPPELARFLASEGVRELSEQPLVILDPACGHGELLEAAWASLPAATRARARFIGLDTDISAVEACMARLRGLQLTDVRVHCADFLEAIPEPMGQQGLFRVSEELVPPGSVDLVIGNPPYVRT